jgi:hypothetical protein
MRAWHPPPRLHWTLVSDNSNSKIHTPVLINQLLIRPSCYQPTVPTIKPCWKEVSVDKVLLPWYAVSVDKVLLINTLALPYLVDKTISLSTRIPILPSWDFSLVGWDFHGCHLGSVWGTRPPLFKGRRKKRAKIEHCSRASGTSAMLSWRRLHAVRIHTRRSLGRHDYTLSIELSALHIHLDVHCLFCS